MRPVFGFGFLMLCLPGLVKAEEKELVPRVGWFVVLQSKETGRASEEEDSKTLLYSKAVEAARKTIQSLKVELVDNQKLNAELRAVDNKRGVQKEAGKLLARGRELHLGLKLEQAVDWYGRAIGKLEQGFPRYYDPGLMAEPILQLGVALFEANQKDAARKAFMRVVTLVPGLQLSEGYYSPSIRKAFNQARSDLGVLRPGSPSPLESQRICQALNLKGLLTASAETLGDRPLLRLALFDVKTRNYSAVETMVLNESTAAVGGREVAQRLLPSVASMAGVAWLQPVDHKDIDGGVSSNSGEIAKDGDPDFPQEHLAEKRKESGAETPDGGVGFLDLSQDSVPSAEPWYQKYWWVWPVAAVVVGTAVALPLTVFRQDVVDVNVQY